MAGVLLAQLVVMFCLEPGMTPPGFTGRGAYAMGIVFFGAFVLAARVRRTEFFLIFGAVAAFLLYPFQLGDNNLRYELGDRRFSPEILASTGSWVIYVVIAALLTRMIAKVRWRLVVDVPLEHPLCRHCGYDLRAAEAICPECGKEFDRHNTQSFRSARRHWDWRWLVRRSFVVAVGFTLPATGIGFANAGPLEHLCGLELPESQINDAGLIPISKLTSLSELQLDASQIDDAGLACLASMPHLSALSIKRTTVTDSGLIQLVECRELDFLALSQTKVTKNGVEKFRVRRPDVYILWP